MTSLPSISVIVPVYNGGAHLARCLHALRASDHSAHEIIVVDDCSTDGAVALLSEPPALAGGPLVRIAYDSGRTASLPEVPNNGPELRLLRLGSIDPPANAGGSDRTNCRLGPAAARNAGATHASGDVLLFVDADVVVQRDTLARIAAMLGTQPEVAAVFGSYDDSPAEPNFASQYKNLLHHFVHQQSSPEAGTFWTGCGAIRREVFNTVGGFDAAEYRTPSIEDIELGSRLRRRGFRIVLDKGLQVKHLKRWTLQSLTGADIFNRALPWSRLILEQQNIPNDLNLRFRDRIAAALATTSIGLAALSLFSTRLLLGTLAALTVVFIVNLPLLRFLSARRGPAFAAKSFAMQALYYSYSSAVFAFCYAEHVVHNIRKFIRPSRSDRGLVKDA